MSEITIIAALLAGLFSFFSPCIFPIIPGFLGFISGVSDAKQSRFKIFLNSFFFVLGFSTIFAILGVLLNTFLEAIAYDVQIWLGRIGGVIIIFFALFMLGIIKLNFLKREHKIQFKKNKWGYLGSFIFGAAFAVGWSPCIGALLGSVFALAITQPALSFWLLITYATGLGIPFLVAGWFSKEMIALIKKSGKFLKYFNIVVGITLLILGLLVFFNSLNLISYLSLVSI